MNQTTSKVNFDDKKMKLDWFNLKKIILGTVQEDQFLCISLKFDYKFQFLIVTVFLSLFLDLLLLGPSSYFISHLPSHLYPPRGH